MTIIVYKCHTNIESLGISLKTIGFIDSCMNVKSCKNDFKLALDDIGPHRNILIEIKIST
jgi:hypothetical protein